MFDDPLEDFCDVYDGDLIAVLRCYVDASAKDSGLLTVAGYVFESLRVRPFQKAWRSTFGDEPFSWADLVARQKQFKPLRDDRKEHDRLVAAGVKLVRDHVVAGTVASIWIQDVENFSPKWIKGFSHAYSVAGHMALAGMGTWAKENNLRGGIAYVIEAGDDGYDELSHMLSYAPRSADARDMYQWNSHAVVEKKAGSAFHAPDLLAWEWGKFLSETVIEPKREMRLSFAHLLNGRLKSHLLQHLYGEPLLRFFTRINALGVEQMQEDREAALMVQRTDVSAAVDASVRSERAAILE